MAGLPLVDFLGTLRYLAGVDDKPETFHWREAKSNGRIFVPLLCCPYEEFVDFLRKPLPDGESLYIPLRSSFVLDEKRHLCIGAAVFPVQISNAFQIAWRHEGFDLIKRFCALSAEDEPPTDNPFLLEVHTKLCANKEKWKERDRKAKEADARARKLLESNLDEFQLKELRERNRFRVFGQDGHMYLILPLTHGNVLRIVNHRPVVNYCIVPKAEVDIPLYDQMLAQKLLLEQNIESFMSVANAKELTDEDNLPDV